MVKHCQNSVKRIKIRGDVDMELVAVVKTELGNNNKSEDHERQLCADSLQTRALRRNFCVLCGDCRAVQRRAGPNLTIHFDVKSKIFEN